MKNYLSQYCLGLVLATAFISCSESGNPYMPFGDPTSRLVFVQNSEICVIDDDGQNYKVISGEQGIHSVDQVRISRDGTKVVFVRNQGNGYGIFLVDVRSSHTVRLTPDTLYGYQPAFSPNGKAMVFTQKGGISLMNLESGEVRILFQRISPDQYVFEPSFSPDGSKIIFSHGVMDSPSQLGTMNWDGSNFLSLGPGYYPQFFPKGNRLLFFSDGDMYVMNSDGSNRNLVARVYTNGHPSISPDGDQAVYYGGFYEIGSIICSIGLTDGVVRTISKSKISDSDPSYSPDGRLIAYVASSYGARGEILSGAIMTMRPDGSDKRTLRRFARGVSFLTYWH